jgi:cation transport regulator ChaB
MPYETIEELPTQVRLSLDEAQQEKWRELYNAHPGPWQLARRDAWRALSTLEDDVRWFSAWASVQVQDGHETVFDIDAMARCMPPFIDNGGEVALMHRAGTYGTIYDYDVREHPSGKVGIYVLGTLYRGQQKYDMLWDAMKRRLNDDGEVMLGLSIGAYTDGGMHWVCDDELCEYRLITTDIKEFSLTNTPSNPLALGIANGNARTRDKEDKIMTEEVKREDAPEGEDLQEIVRSLGSRVEALETANTETRSMIETGFQELRSMLERKEPEEEEEEDERNRKSSTVAVGSSGTVRKSARTAVKEEERSLHSEEFAEFKTTTERTIEELRTQLLQATTHTPAPFAKVETASYGEGDTEAISRVFFGRK